MQRVIAFGSAIVLLTACGDGDGRDTDTQGQITSASQGLTTLTTTSETGDGTETETGEDTEAGTDGSSGDASTDATDATGDPTTGDPTDEPTTDDPTTGDPTDDPTTGNPTTGDPTDSDSDTGEECAAISESAELKPLPADIIFALDTSGSMDIEISSVKNNMNAFSSTIINSGVDAHVVVIADPGEVCIAAPLGSGMCPADSNEPVYLHVNEGVGSNNALDKVLNTHDLWKDSMRPDGLKHVVVVSDDNASMGANAFHNAFKAFGPEYESYRFHAIVSEIDSGDILECAQNAVCCALTADKGDVYLDLIAMTGGLFGDLCDQDFTPIFNELSTEVVDSAPIPCEFEIPEPMGEDIDFGKVNVQFDYNGMEEVFPKVEGPEQCMDVPDGWYYDDEQNPTKIVLCDATCAKVQGEENGEINVQFGCDTVVPQ